jgi:hypothetical protein
MGFFRTAYYAGAEAYGQKRAEKYGRRVKAFRVIAFLAVLGFIGYCWMIGR